MVSKSTWRRKYGCAPHTLSTPMRWSAFSRMMRDWFGTREQIERPKWRHVVRAAARSHEVGFVALRPRFDSRTRRRVPRRHELARYDVRHLIHPLQCAPGPNTRCSVGMPTAGRCLRTLAGPAAEHLARRPAPCCRSNQPPGIAQEEPEGVLDAELRGLLVGLAQPPRLLRGRTLVESFAGLHGSADVSGLGDPNRPVFHARFCHHIQRVAQITRKMKPFTTGPLGK